MELVLLSPILTAVMLVLARASAVAHSVTMVGATDTAAVSAQKVAGNVARTAWKKYIYIVNLAHSE